MTRQIALIPGDGVGAEVLPAAVRVLEALGLDFEYVEGKPETPSPSGPASRCRRGPETSPARPTPSSSVPPARRPRT